MIETPWTVRQATPADAGDIAQLINDLNRHEGLEPLYSEALVLRDGFGEDAAYHVLVAQGSDRLIGYAAYQAAYDTERGGRSLWLLDLYVAPEARGGGAGRALMRQVARVACDHGCVSLWWGVRSCNRQARAFYAGLGAIDDDARILELAGPALSALATETALPTPLDSESKG